MRRLACLAACVCVLGACGKPPPSHTVADPFFDAAVSYPSSAEYDVRAKDLLVGSYDDGAVRRVAMTGVKANSARALPQDGRKHVLRIRLDTERQRIWVLDSAGLYAYDAGSSKLIRHWTLDETQHSNEHCLPDIALHPSGTLFVSSAIRPKLWRIDGATLEASDHDIRTDADEGKDFGFSALAFAGDSNTLYAASALTGALWKVDPSRDEATKLSLPAPLTGACALHAMHDRGRGETSWSLYVAGGFREGAARVQLSPDGRAVSVNPVKRAMRAAAPLAFVQTDRDLLLVSSHLGDHPEFNGAGRSGKGLTLVSLLAQ